jgi:hypothetical protein
MSRLAGVRKKLERELGQRLPDYVWEDADLQDMAQGYLNAANEEERQDEWEVMTHTAAKRMRMVEKAWADNLRGVSRGLSAEPGKAPYSHRRSEEEVSLTPGYAISTKTDAMLRAMSEFFAGLAHQHPDVVAFRKDVLGCLLSEDEAHALLASPAARMFPPEWFAEWEIPVIGHSATIKAQEATASSVMFDHRVTVRMDPPGTTKKVRYADPRLLPSRELDAYRTRCMSQNGATIPPVSYMPRSEHGGRWYPPWMWPGSVVYNLFELSDDLAQTFDWPTDGFDQLESHAGAWFVLTGEAPAVRPLGARWEQKGGKHLLSQWRVELTVPAWLPSDELLRAYALMRQRMLGDRIRLPDPTTLEAARFVWEQERRNGYERPSWPVLLERWNSEHPEAAFKSYNNFRTVCMRGVKAVLDLNFSPLPPSGSGKAEE